MNMPLPSFITDWSSPEAVKARGDRIAAANEARRIRHDSLRLARAVIRKHKVRGTEELLEAMQNLHASYEGMDSLGKEYADKLLELICDMETDMRSELEPEMGGFDVRGEYDNQTLNVRHRNYGG